MIKFFRKARQKMLTENKFSEYLMYVLGEIILVLIGILIAVQINNWNINQKDAAQETKILIQLKEGFTVDRSKMKTELKNLAYI